jgi:signal transduction histidine kinase
MAQGGVRGGATALKGLVDQPALASVATSFASVHGVGLAIEDDSGLTVIEVRPEEQAPLAAKLQQGQAHYADAPVLHGGRPVGKAVVGPYVSKKLAGLPRLTKARAQELAAHLAALVSALVARPGLLVPGEVASRAAQALGSLSHELRTPLTSIIGYSDMLAEGLLGPLSPEQQEGARTILERSESLLLTLNSLLDLAATALGPVALMREPTDLAELLADAVEALAAVARRAEVRVRVEVEPRLPAVAADRARLKESLVQLLGNAIKFNHRGGLVTVKVHRRPGTEPQLLELEVEDNGIGIEAAQLPRLFEPFYQVDSSPTRSFPGVGIGLALVKAHAEAHGGEVRVESTPGKGSRFTMALPMVRV